MKLPLLYVGDHKCLKGLLFNDSEHRLRGCNGTTLSGDNGHLGYPTHFTNEETEAQTWDVINQGHKDKDDIRTGDQTF